jgi:hypothetical protein
MADQVSTEDEILGGIDIGEDTSNEDTSGDEGEAGQSTQESGTQDEANPLEQGQSSAKSKSGTKTQPAKSDKSTGPQPLRDANGNVIADGGRERRFYEAAQVARQENARLQGELEKATAKVAAYETANTISTQLGLSADEATTGAKLMAAYKNNPVETIKYLLTEAQAAGHNVTGIVSGGTDVAAIKQLIEQAFKPINDERAGKERATQVEQQAVREYNNFISRFPDAKIHETTIARLLQSDPSLSVEAAYYKLQSFYLAKQLDWKKPLEVLAEEMKGQQQPQGDTPSVTRQPGLPGRGTSVTNAQAPGEIADVNTSIDDIVKESMREAGLSI